MFLQEVWDFNEFCWYNILLKSGRLHKGFPKLFCHYKLLCWGSFSYEPYENVSSISLKGQWPEISTVAMTTQQDMVPWKCAAF